MTTRLGVAAAVAALLLTGCTSASDETASEGPSVSPTAPASPDSPTSSATTPKPQRRWVLDAVGVHVRTVREWSAEEGVEVAEEVVRDCRLLRGVVIAQDPAPRTRIAVGDTIAVTVGRAPVDEDCAPPPARPAARAFYSWSLGERGAPAFAPRVRVLQGNEEVRVLDAAAAAQRDSWLLPPYAERVETNLLDWMADEPLLQHSTSLSPYCLVRLQALPDDLVDRLWWSGVLNTTSADACMDMGAVQVWVDGRGRIDAVNHLNGAP